ncbi:hypothetical protein Cgig2_017516 [Carnegiea gigantea]|uniref:Uncharacterized protein n=1 Tax=Carnegiea gigantea TaxID=171969 RepID=A0A9Q1QBG2_9CARY|nr:hypothetical protein Cgig2_017516 [Carnegiea gigantea]
MAEKILERGDHGEEFQRDFVHHIISTSIIRSMDNDCLFRTLKLFMDLTKYLTIIGVRISCNLSLEKRDAKIDGFQQQYIGQLMQSNKQVKMKRSFAGSIKGICEDRWFPTVIHWTVDVVKQRNKDEKEFPEEHGKDRAINREEYQKIIHEKEIQL